MRLESQRGSWLPHTSPAAPLCGESPPAPWRGLAAPSAFPPPRGGNPDPPVRTARKELTRVCPVRADTAFPSMDVVTPKSMPARRCSSAGLSPAEGRPPHAGVRPLWHRVAIWAAAPWQRSVPWQGQCGALRGWGGGHRRGGRGSRPGQTAAGGQGSTAYFPQRSSPLGLLQSTVGNRHCFKTAPKKKKNLFQAGFAVETLLKPAVPAPATASSTTHKVDVLSRCSPFICPAKEQFPGCKTCGPHHCHSLSGPPCLHTNQHPSELP